MAKQNYPSQSYFLQRYSTAIVLTNSLEIQIFTVLNDGTIWFLAEHLHEIKWKVRLQTCRGAAPQADHKGVPWGRRKIVMYVVMYVSYEISAGWWQWKIWTKEKITGKLYLLNWLNSLPFCLLMGSIRLTHKSFPAKQELETPWEALGQLSLRCGMTAHRNSFVFWFS